MEGKDYTDRACCESGGIEASGVCPNNTVGLDSEGSGAIIGMVVGAVAGLAAIGGCCFCLNKMRLSIVGGRDSGNKPIVIMHSGQNNNNNPNTITTAGQMQQTPAPAHVHPVQQATVAGPAPVVAQVVQPVVMNGSYHNQHQQLMAQPMYASNQQQPTVVVGSVYSPSAPPMNPNVRHY